MNRVVVTGIAGFSPIGNDWQSIYSRLKTGETGIVKMPEWDKYEGLNTRLGAKVDFSVPAHYSRKDLRSMGRVAQLAVVSAENALIDANLLNAEILKSGLAGVAFGSSAGDTEAIADFGNMLLHNNCDGLNANTYIKMMAHTSPVNIGIYFGLKGRVYTTSSACTSSSMGIGQGYEAIKFGQQKIMLAGGCEHLCATEAAVFDTLYATSTVNDTPNLTPRPFDKDRDGLVIGEGACTLVLEELEHAEQRGAKIYAELVGFGTNSDGRHITQPNAQTMEQVIRLSLEDAGISAQQVGYVSAHGTATDRGDIAETQATTAVFGKNMPISSLKSFTGHTLGACGAIEAWVAIEMMRNNWFHPTANLDNVDENCGELDYIMQQGREINTDYIMSNNFAFGGINTSLIFKRWNN
ncbi:beta-ketoacyl-ACP synthase [Aliiglaciecola lipolytica]|uniref:3-oxoacyl-[acyl-carrier-protein] synthase II n=1 Tax=Aliiglaciecola lipolytica E3 TaxID=1127673 RepID=K6XN76_9ALTE|nr:beta-ketoacyl-ACP synthase [Aliiglaciecola lipolytica]GAC13141.1 3-oxoacyl-[acyl-carrier-protein] synthase II [Aliiglaciecola lipolytica E3]